MMKPSRRTWFMLGLCAVCTLIILWLQQHEFDGLVKSERYLQDLRMRLGKRVPAHPDLVFVGMDKPTYEVLEGDVTVRDSPTLQKLGGSFPWPRSVWADLINRLGDAGAKVIALDILFAGPSADDEALAKALEVHKDKVIIVSSFTLPDNERGHEGAEIPPSSSLLPTPPDGWLPGDDRVGYDKLWPDADEVVRRARFRLSESAWLSQHQPDWGDKKLPEERYYDSLAARILKKSGHAQAIPPGESMHLFRFTGSPGKGYRPHPINEIFVPGIWKERYQDGEFFKGKIVLVGAATEQFQDLHYTPFDRARMLGPEIHLNVVGAALNGAFLRETSPFVGGLMILLTGVFSGFLCLRIRAPILRSGIVLVTGVLVLVAGQVLFDRADLIIFQTGPLLVLGLCGAVTFGYDFILEQYARLKLLTTMAYYFSPKVLKSVLANPGSMEPREANVTLLLTDLRNSTPLAELLGPKGMFALLNKVFEAQTTVIMDEEGNLEHFLGDQFLSYWGAPQEQPDAADRSWRAALKLVEAMDQLHASLPPEVNKLFGYGVALHYGQVLVGNKGSAKRLDFGLVGDTVNAAARIEALTKYYGLKLLISGDFLGRLNVPVVKRKVDVVIVKGKSQAVELYEAAPAPGNEKQQALFVGYEAAFARYVAGEFAPAALDFDLLAHAHADAASRVLAERCRQLAGRAPKDWKGVWEMDRK